MREMKCPVCGGEVPRTVLRSKTFPCPTCKEQLRHRDWSPLLTTLLGVCGYSLTFVIAERMGLRGNGLLVATIFLGPLAGFLVGAVLVLPQAWVFCIPPRLQRDPGPRSSDGGVLHIESPPGPRDRPS